MFKTPEWDDDVPKIHTSFLKKCEKKNEKIPTEIKKEKSVLNVNKIRQNKQAASNLHSPKTGNVHKRKIKKNKKYTSNNKNVQGKQNIEKHNNDTSRKRKLDTKPVNIKKKKVMNSDETQNLEKISDTQNFDEILLNAKKKKFNQDIEDDDKEELLFSENTQKKKKKRAKSNNINNTSETNGHSSVMNPKKKKLKVLLNTESYRRHINVENKSNQLRQRMLERLKAAQFRYLNEKLYTSSGSEAKKLFQEDPTAFETYHQGYQLQVKKWPVNPLDVIVKKIMKMPKSHLIADMGCGEAALSKRIPHTVRSFDLVATAPEVEACDMARTPLLTASVNVTVYCLALMGTDLTQYLIEANRVLMMGGHLLIAEVESRFDNVDNFTKEVERLGFKLKQLDKSNKVFFFMEFTKIRDPPVKKSKLPVLTLKPCLYKKR